MAITNFTSLGEQALFKRRYTLSLGDPGNLQAKQFGTNTNPPSPIRITFDIDRAMTGTPGKAKIDIYNLTKETIQSIKKGYLVELEAGYKDIFETLFIGNVVEINLSRNGPDIVLSLECGDSESAIIFSAMNINYGQNTKLTTILSDIAEAMNVTTDANPVGVNAGVSLGIPEVTYYNGFMAVGACRDVLDKLLKPQNLDWAIINGNLNIIPKDKHNGNTAILVSSATGMLGVPSKHNNNSTFVSLLNPNLIPGALVKLESTVNPLVNGNYKVLRSKYEGDTHDSKWQVTCECVFIGADQTEITSVGFDFSGVV